MNNTEPAPIRRTHLDGTVQVVEFATFAEKAEYLWLSGVFTAAERDEMIARD